MIRVEDWAEIRRLHRAEGLSARAVARQLGISRNTVLRALASDRPPVYRRAARGSAVDAVEPAVRELLTDMSQVRYVWRHLPLTDVHPHAQLAAEAAEAAAEQDAFWPMHDLLLDRQDALTLRDLLDYANELGLDSDRFAEQLRTRAATGRIEEDTESADLSGVSGTPTFFINGRRHYGAYDVDTLTMAVKAALARSAATR